MIGVDEVGRGCLAGPLLVVAARQIKDLPSDITDSKLLTRIRRENFFDLLLDICEFGEGWVKVMEIDKFGLAKALRLGVRRALHEIEANAEDEITLDGPINYAPVKFIKATCMIDADFHVPIVSAASIYAKVRRDRLMYRLKSFYPKYGFESHVGYGTLSHRRAIQDYGPIKNIHRMSFRPLRLLNGS